LKEVSENPELEAGVAAFLACRKLFLFYHHHHFSIQCFYYFTIFKIKNLIIYRESRYCTSDIRILLNK